MAVVIDNNVCVCICIRGILVVLLPESIFLLLFGSQFTETPLSPDLQQTGPSRNVSYKVLCTDLAEIPLFSMVLSIFFLILHLSEQIHADSMSRLTIQFKAAH